MLHILDITNILHKNLGEQLEIHLITNLVLAGYDIQNFGSLRVAKGSFA